VRVGIVTEYYYPLLGGITENVFNTKKQLKALGHDVTVITSLAHRGMFRVRKSRDVVDPDVVRVGHSVPVYSNGSFAHLSVGVRIRARLRSVFDWGQFDVLHLHSPITPTLPIEALLAATCPTVGTFHTYFERSLAYAVLKNAIQTRALDRMAGQIAVSRNCVDALSRYFTTRAEVIPNGVDVDLFHPDRPPLPIFDDGRPNLLFVGRFDPRNGLALMLRAFAIVRERRPDARLIVVGDGPLSPYYRSMVPPALRDDVHFVGLVRDMRPAYYATCDVFCSPVTKASFGVTLLEAMAAGKPIVATENIGYRELMSPAEGILVPPADPAAFAAAVLRLLDNPALRREIGAAGREKAEAYSWERIGRTIADYYEGILVHA